MDIEYKLELLKDSSSTEREFDQILSKLIDTLLSQQRLRVGKYKRDLHEFEERYGMDSASFYRRFESGELGDAMDYFEWAGLYELYLKSQRKIQRLEQTE
jgi:hypothetical protein